MNDDLERFSDLLEGDIESVELKTDENGFIRVLFDGEELDEVNSYLLSELTTTHDDYGPIWANAVENLETYKAIKIAIENSGKSIYPMPLARIPADQVIASIYDSVMQPKPIFAIDAYLKAQYKVPQQQQSPVPPIGGGEMPPGPPPTGLQPAPPSPMGAASPMPPPGGNTPPMPAMPPGLAPVADVTAEEIAKRFRQGYEFIVRERIEFPRKFLKAVGGAVKGCPYWWKIVADPQEHTKLAPKVSGILVDLDDKYESTRTRGDIVKHYLVPFTNGMMPLDEDDIAISRWFAERSHKRSSVVIKEFAAGKNFLIKDEKEAKDLAANTTDVYDPFRARAEATTSKKAPQSPTQTCPIWLTWFYHDVKFKDPSDGQTKIKRLNLVGDFHLSAGKLLNCYINQYEHQERPYELIDQFDDGGSTVENMKYHQTVATHLMQAEIKNAFHANNMMYWFDADNAELASFFAKNKVLGAGDHVPGIFEKDWGLTRAGAEHYSMLELVKFVLSMSQLDSKQSKYSSGDPGGRTPAYTMQQAVQRAEMEPHLFLHRLSSKLSRILRLDMETRRQFQPLGEILPVWDDQAKATVEIPFQFPVGDVLDNFRIALTASDDALAKEQDPQQIMAQKQALMTDGEYVAKILAAIINIDQPLPQSAVALFEKIIKRDQMKLADFVGTTTTDEDEYDLTKEIEAVIAERNAALQAKQSQPPPEEKPKPPNFSISLSGVMPPELVLQAATMAGMHTEGISAQVQVPPGQGTLPGHAGGGTPGPPAVGAQHGIPPHPNIPPPQGGQAVGGGNIVQ